MASDPAGEPDLTAAPGAGPKVLELAALGGTLLVPEGGEGQASRAKGAPLWRDCVCLIQRLIFAGPPDNALCNHI
jgi:hypothetical protein